MAMCENLEGTKCKILTHAVASSEALVIKGKFISKCKCVSLNVEVGRLFPCEQGVC